MAKQRKNLNAQDIFLPPPPVAPTDRFQVLRDGEIWEFELNVDFRGSGKNFISAAKTWARENGYGLDINASKGSSIYLMAREPTPAELARSESSKKQVLLTAYQLRMQELEQVLETAV
jgi:hypothetical protein